MSTRRINNQKGFSIVELMLALGLGLVVVTGIVQLFIGNSQTSALIAGQARLQENARFAFDFISRATRRAGYFGCSPEAQNIVRGLTGMAGVPPFDLVPEYDFTEFIEGHESDGAGNWTPPLTFLPGGTPGNTNFSPAGEIDPASLALATTPSDVLVVRNLQEPGQTLTQTLQPLGDPVVTAPGGNPGFGIGDIVMVADCEQGAVFRVTGLNIAGNTATVLHAAGAGFFGNAVNVNSPVGVVPFTLSFLGRSYGPEAVVGAIQTTYFFVAPSTRADNQGNIPDALWQKVGSAGPVELIQGIDTMDILYGVDTTLADGIPNPNQYVTADAVPDPSQIVAIRVTIGVNSVDAVTEDGNRLTRTFSKTILVRNANPEA